MCLETLVYFYNRIDILSAMGKSGILPIIMANLNHKNKSIAKDSAFIASELVYENCISYELFYT